MSAENVEFVRSLQPPPETDLVEFFRPDGGEDAVRALMEVFRPSFTDDFVCIFHALSPEPRRGVEGLRQNWLDWLEPWESYRFEIEDAIDAGDRVLVLSNDFARKQGMDEDVRLIASAVWTVRDGKIAHAEFFTDRAAAFEAVGIQQ